MSPVLAGVLADVPTCRNVPKFRAPNNWRVKSRLVRRPADRVRSVTSAPTSTGEGAERCSE